MNSTHRTDMTLSDSSTCTAKRDNCIQSMIENYDEVEHELKGTEFESFLAAECE